MANVGVHGLQVKQGGSDLQIQLTGRHVSVTDDVREYVYDKAAKLPRFYNRIHEIEVVLDHESEQFTVDMIVRVDRKHTFVAKETGTDTFVLVDRVVDRLERQLVKHKEKNRNHRQDGKGDPPTIE